MLAARTVPCEIVSARARRTLESALHEKAGRGRHGLLSSESPTGELIEHWLIEVDQSDRTAATKRIYREIATHTLTPALGDIRLHELTVGRVDRFIRALYEERGYSAAVAARKVLKQALAAGVRLDALHANPAADVPLPKRVSRPVEAPTLDTVRRLRDHVAAWETAPATFGRARSPELADMVDFLAATGARPGEMLALRWVDVDLEAGTVAISGTTIVDQENRAVRQEHTKSRAGMRVLTVPTFARDMLMRRRVDATSEYVFPSATGGVKSAGNLRRKWRAATAGSEFAGLTPRDIRKAVATALAEVLDAKAAQAQLGHATPAVTERHYIKPAAMPDVSALLERE